MAHGLSYSAAKWDLPGPGLEPVSPALAGRFLSTALPGKSQQSQQILKMDMHVQSCSLLLKMKLLMPLLLIMGFLLVRFLFELLMVAMANVI